MLNRYTVSLGLALLAMVATTGISYAADDRMKVEVGTFLVAAGLMAFLLLVYLAKWLLGATNTLPPPEPDAGHDAHH